VLLALLLLLLLLQVYAVLREDWTSGGGHTVCSSQSDAGAVARLVYSSKSNVVEARLVTQKSAQFLLKVECNHCWRSWGRHGGMTPTGFSQGAQTNGLAPQDFVDVL